ncbi:MAG: cupin [Chloroflexi bacterium]|nr:MAG: cupin [Chloroflexota bacterium]TMG08036.1 MAG: cupin [Chloroflexota bacterium]
MGAALTRWRSVGQPTKEELESIFRDEGLRPSWWSNAPGDRYSAHSHPYHKVLYCAQGSIRFDLPASGESFELHPGDRIDISPGTHHSALVGPEGVTCVEAARSA